MKKNTRIDHSERIQRVIRYIEEHLDEPLRLKSLSSIACFSEYHFHRIFVAFMGMTVQEYIVYRRIVKGASLLLNTSLRATDIALEAGFESLSSFTKLFTTYFSLSPSKFRRLRAHEKVEVALPDLFINLEKKVKDRCPQRRMRSRKISYEKHILPDLKAVVATKAGMHDGSFCAPAKECFDKIYSYVERNKLHDRIGYRLSLVPHTPLSHNDPEAVIHCGFSINGEVPLENDIDIITITGGNYAVFLHHGPYEYIRHTYQSAFFSCVFSGKDQIRNAPSFEIYHNSPRDTAPEDLKTEIHIPVE